MKMVADPIEERHLCVCVMTSDHEHDGVEPQEPAHQARESELGINRKQNDRSKNKRKHLQKPGEKIVTSDGGPDKKNSQTQPQTDMKILIWIHWLL